jgi:hypothetical protein
MRAQLRGWHLAVMLVAVSIIGVGVQVAYASVFGVTTTSGGAVVAVAAARGAADTTTSGASYVALPGARLTMRGRGLLVIRFTAESLCTGGVTDEYCSVVVMVDGVEAKPAVGIDYAFDTNDGGSWEGNAVDRSIKVGTGLHTIQVMYATTSGSTSFRLDDWHMTVERAVA